ncbi:MAG: VWA domain-containing protein [Planctomycetes bacterium]|nr:VWA domain-containing protein [Planctomycetota bacterium]
MIAFWPFANTWMLLWGLAAVVPLLIHLWSRRRYNAVPWAAMEFLLTAIRRSARRWRFEQLLLLLLRMLVLLLLAVALADPVVMLHSAFADPARALGDTHFVLVVDASYSMDFRQGETTRFELAKASAGQVVRESRQGDGFSLVRMTAAPDVVIAEPAFDPADVAGELAELRRSDSGADLVSTLGEVERIVDRAAEAHPRFRKQRVLFFSDAGRSTWADATSEAARAVFARLGEKAELQLLNVARGDDQNVAVVRLAAEEGVAIVAQPTRLWIELENFGNQDRVRQKVELLVDGQRVSEQYVNVEAGGRASLMVPHEFAGSGEHVVEARLGADRLEADNHRWLVLSVRSSLGVLCVEGEMDAAKHVAIALEPGLLPPARVRVDVMSEVALLEEDLHKYDCVFLCNVGRFDGGEARALREFARRGGGVVFFLGDLVQPSNYNEVFGGDAGLPRLLPARLVEPVVAGEFFLNPLDYRHPIVQPFRGHERAGLLTVPVWRYYRLEPYAPADTEFETAALFDTDDPAIVEASAGWGRVLMVTTAASSTSLDQSTTPATPWSAMAEWPSFPPLVQGMLSAAVRGRADLRNVLVNQPIQGVLARETSGRPVIVSDPAGQSQQAVEHPHEGPSGWTYDLTGTAGPYTARSGGDADAVMRFAVNLDTRESRLERFDEALLPSQFRQDASAADGADDQLATARPARFFRHVLVIVLLLMICETFLAWLFGRSAV